MERAPGSLAPYRDVRNAAGYAPESWTLSATRFGYSHLLERLDAGELPAAPQARAEAAEAVERSWARAARKVDAAGRAERAALRDLILARLD